MAGRRASSTRRATGRRGPDGASRRPARELRTRRPGGGAAKPSPGRVAAAGAPGDRDPRLHVPDVHINLNVRGMRPSATMAIQARCDGLVRERRDVVRLGLGQSPFPVPRAVVEALQANAHQKAYLPVKGLPALRSAVAEYHRRSQSIPCDAQDVLVGPGSKELMFLLQLVYYGDLVVPTPAWVSYAPQARIVGRQIRWIHTTRASGWRLEPGDLADLCSPDPERPRIVVMNYPSNPTGLTYDDARLREIAAVARRHRVVLLSDEIYGELHHRGRHASVARHYPEGTIVSSGLSKWCGAGGWRLGTFTFPRTLGWLLEAISAVASETYTSTSAPVQYAAVRAFRGGLRIERYLWNARRILAALGTECARRLRAAGAHVDLPEGGFYLFPDFTPLADRLAARGVADSTELCSRLLEETGVGILPGTDFGRPPEELTARIAYVDFDGARAMAAAEVLPRDAPLDEEFVAANCGRVIDGIDRLCEWVSR